MFRESDYSCRRRGTVFEDKIRKFLRNIGFEDTLEWGRNRQVFMLGNQEIDGFAREDDLYIVVDAKTTSSLKKRGKGVRKQLTLINGYKSRVIDDIKARYSHQHGYRDTIFIFWTKDIKIIKEAKDLAQKYEIALRDHFDLEFYVKAFNLLKNSEDEGLVKKIVRNNLLKDIRLQLDKLIFKEGLPKSVDAIRIKIKDKEIYTFLLSVEDLLKFAYVFRIETNNLLFSYQRLLQPRKIKKIMNYLSSGGYFPNNLIAVSHEKLKFEEDKKSKMVMAGKLELPDKPAYLEIIDGQHRLYGCLRMPHKESLYLCITVIEKLRERERAELFLTINKNQTPVPADLLWDLYLKVDPTSAGGRISKFVQELNNETPFKDLIKLPRIRSSRAYLSFVNICTALEKRTGLFKKYNSRGIFKSVIRSFFEGISKADGLRKDWERSTKNKSRKGFLCTNVVLSISFILLQKILEKTDLPDSNKIEEWKNNLDNWIIEPLKKYLEENKGENSDDPYADLRKINTSEGARRKTADEIFKKSPLLKLGS